MGYKTEFLAVRPVSSSKALALGREGTTRRLSENESRLRRDCKVKEGEDFNRRNTLSILSPARAG